MILEEYGAAAQPCRNGLRKEINQLELNLASDVKGNKKGFYKYSSSKRKRESCWMGQGNW